MCVCVCVCVCVYYSFTILLYFNIFHIIHSGFWCPDYLQFGLHSTHFNITNALKYNS